MPRVNFDNVTETTGNGGGLPNGPYVLKVVSASWQPKDRFDNEQTWADFVFDIAEGEYEDALAKRPDFAHTVQLRFDRNVGLLKHSLACLSRSNTSTNGAPFDAEGAFNALIDPEDPRHRAAPKAFVGKLFGGNVVEYHKPKKDGTDGTTKRVWTWYDVAEIHAGVDKEGKPIEPLPDQYKAGYTPGAYTANPMSAEYQSAAGAEIADEDIPF